VQGARRRVLTAGCALALALAGCGGSGSADGFTVMQMNLCLSGLAGCYDHAVVSEAAGRVAELHPDAVTLNEACRGDVARIARRTGYHLRFSVVAYRGERLRCVQPRGRGLFGDAVLTRGGVARSESHAFAAQQGLERRRWLCVGTRGGPDVCTAHLNTRSSSERAGNRAQCLELARVLARRGTFVFAGDVNRSASCAPAGAWTRTDRSAHQAPGLQHAYGSASFRSPVARVLPARHTDHDVLVVSAG
jgi:endonuclease/exonuclease/phosphatase family metal-dependent hydrolase